MSHLGISTEGFLCFQPLGDGRWIAVSESRWWPVEFIASGNDDEPDLEEIDILEDFQENAETRILPETVFSLPELREKLVWPNLYTRNSGA